MRDITITETKSTNLTTADGEALTKVYLEAKEADGSSRTMTAYVSEHHYFFGNDFRDYLIDAIGADYYEAAAFCAADSSSPYSFMVSDLQLAAMLQHFLGENSSEAIDLCYILMAFSNAACSLEHYQSTDFSGKELMSSHKDYDDPEVTVFEYGDSWDYITFREATTISEDRCGSREFAAFYLWDPMPVTMPII